MHAGPEEALACPAVGPTWQRLTSRLRYVRMACCQRHVSNFMPSNVLLTA